MKKKRGFKLSQKTDGRTRHIFYAMNPRLNGGQAGEVRAGKFGERFRAALLQPLICMLLARC